MHVQQAKSKELCAAFGFSLVSSGKLLIENRNNLSGTSAGAWQ
jgi:hypothetical protein